MAANSLHVEFLPTITILSVSRISIFFFEWCHIGVLLQVAGVDAGARSEEVAFHITLMRRFNRVHVDERTITDYFSLVRLYEANASHIGSETIDFINILTRF